MNQTKSKEKQNNKLYSAEDFGLPEDITPAYLKEQYDIMKQYYLPLQKRMMMLDSTDRGELWKAINAKFPCYQILPDTNYISYVKNNLLASIYTVTKGADIIPTTEEDKDIVVNLNIFRERVWDMLDIGYFQFLAGERASLLNMGITQVGWAEDIPLGQTSGDPLYRSNVTLKNIDPIKFMRSPFAPDLDSSEICCTYDQLHKTVYEANKNYKERFKTFMAKNSGTTPQEQPNYAQNQLKGQAKDYFNLVIFWVMHEGKMYEIHTIDAEYILHTKEVKPAMFPFAELYCNVPARDLTGVSEPAKIFANNVAYNLLDSIALTSEYKNQRPPKFVSAQSGLNIQQFIKHGDEADKTFIVNGDATKAVHYHQFPQISPAVPNMKISLEQGIETVSGVDGRYTGRDTGSIITTGGTQEMLNRVTLVDTPKIVNYEKYCKKLTKLIMHNYIEYGQKRKYFYKNPKTNKYETVEVDFPKIDSKTYFNYALQISSELPKNKQRISAEADALMEKQMQYQQQGQSVQFITPEEWLEMKDLPNKERMLERMGVDRMNDATEEVSQVLFQYADLVKKGMKPDDAILATAQSLKDKRGGMLEDQGPIPALAQESPLPLEGAGPML